MTLRAVLFDVDFTLARPGPELQPEGYTRVGARHGLVLDTAKYGAARDAALVDLKRHPELEHDEEIWVAKRRWSATRWRTTSKERSHSACERCSSTVSAYGRTSSRASTISMRFRQRSVSRGMTPRL